MNKLLESVLKPKTADFVGINLGSYYVKGFVKKDNKIKDYFIEKAGDLSTLIKKIWQEKKINTQSVKISLKSPATLVRYFPFPRVDKKKIKQALYYDLNKHIPFSPSDVYFDFSILDETSPAEFFLLLAAAKKELVDDILGKFEKEKLEVTGINLDSICLMNLFLNGYQNVPPANLCILDIGHLFSTLTIMKKGVPFLTRDLKFGVKDVIQVISFVKNMSIADAEKWMAAVKGSREFLEPAQDSFSNLCREVKSSFDYFEVNKGERIEKMYLTGGLVSLPGFDTVFHDFSGVTIEALQLKFYDNHNEWDLEKNFSDEKMKLFKHSFSAALGLMV